MSDKFKKGDKVVVVEPTVMPRDNTPMEVVKYNYRNSNVVCVKYSKKSGKPYHTYYHEDFLGLVVEKPLEATP